MAQWGAPHSNIEKPGTESHNGQLVIFWFPFKNVSVGYLYICMYVCVYMYVCVCIYMYVCMCIYIYMYIYIHIIIRPLRF